MKETKKLEGFHVEEVKYLETSRGIAFTANLFLDDVKIGFIENKGDGGSTSILVEHGEKRTELHLRMEKYFKNNNVELYDTKESIFSEHLLDVHDFGKVLTYEEKMNLLKNSLN